MVGFIRGPVKIFKNDGQFKFDGGTNITVMGKKMEMSDGGPCIVDWNGDGVLDLLMGEDNGKVTAFVRDKTGINDLNAGTVLLTERPGGGWTPGKVDPKSPTGYSLRQPSIRTKPFAADWNNDGKLDLLVGDFAQIRGPEPKLTKAQIKQRDRLRKQRDTSQVAMSKHYDRLNKAATKASGVKMDGSQVSQENMKKWSDAYMKAMEKDKEYKRLMKTWQATYTKLQSLEAKVESTGFVWVYLRK